MDLAQFDNRIADLKAQSQGVQAEMESMCRGFLAATERYAAQWYAEQIKHARENHPEVITEMPMELLRDLKAQLREVTELVPQLVGETVNLDQYWVHRGEYHRNGTVSRYAPQNRRPPQELDRALRTLLGHLGRVLLEYRLDSNGQSGRWDADADPPRFKGACEWSDPMITAVQRYNMLYEKWARLNEQIIELTRRKNLMVANEKWDQA